MTENPSISLSSSGLRATIEPDPYQPGGFILDIDGTPQSHVFLDDPGEVFFEYIRRMAHVLDEICEPGEPITVVHLGGGALTLPRYIDVTRPGSRQQVIELERDLIDFVREHLPLPKNANVRIRYGDAREVMNRLPAGLRGTVDAVIVDVFSGSRTPAHVTSVEFYQEAAALLSPHGVLIVNVADGPGLAFARGQVATIHTVLPRVIVLAETQVLKGRRFGNLVVVASHDPSVGDTLPRLLAGGPHPASSLSGEVELRAFTASSPIVTDQTAIPSPSANKTIFQIAQKR